MGAHPSHGGEGYGAVAAFEGFDEVFGLELSDDVFVEGGCVGFCSVVGGSPEVFFSSLL